MCYPDDLPISWVDPVGDQTVETGVSVRCWNSTENNVRPLLTDRPTGRINRSKHRIVVVDIRNSQRQSRCGRLQKVA